MLIIANCTKQTLHFLFRLPERRHPSRIDIPSGQQRDLRSLFNLTDTQVEIVRKQCERYGFKRVDEISRHIKNFSGYLYSAKAVSSDNIAAAHEMKVESQEKTSEKEAFNAVLGYEQSTRDKAGKRLAKEVEVEVIEESDPRGPKKDKKVKMKMCVSEQGSKDKREIPVDVD